MSTAAAASSALAIVRRDLTWIWRHPACRGERPLAVLRWLGWQLWQRMVRLPVVVPFLTGELVLCPHSPVVSHVLYVRVPDYHEFGFLRAAIESGAEDSVVIDVGANEGVYTVGAGLMGAAVVSFEPVADVARHLRTNVALNGLEDRVDVRQQAVGSSAGQVEMTATLGPRNRIATGERVGGAEITVDLVAIDEVIPSDANVVAIKVDVEGYELAVLDGAAETIARCRPTLIVEMNDRPGLAAWAAGHDYERAWSDTNAVLTPR